MKKMKKIRYFAIMLAVILLGGCAQTTNIVSLQPSPSIQSSNIGSGKTVTVSVLDERSQSLDAQYAAAKIDPSQNVSQIFTDQINQGLAAKGFNTTATMAANQLTAKIVSINYSAASSYLGQNSQTVVALQVIATNKNGTYSKTYRASSYSDAYLTATRSDAYEQVNNALNKVLTNLLSDQGLLQFLAQG